MTLFNLKGKTVLITGASGGIGNAVADAFYARGANLILTDLNQDALDKMSSSMNKERVLPIVMDVANMPETKAVVEKAIVKFGRLDMAFANAGISASTSNNPTTLLTIRENDFAKVINVDLFGVWYTIKACLPHIIEAKGHILITSSIYAFCNGMVNAPYAVSKAGVEMLGRTLRAELAGTGATAGVLFPGWVATPIAEVAFGGNDIVTDLIKHGFPSLLRKPVKPEAIAAAVVAGVESRRARIISPKRWAPISMFRGIFNMATDSVVDRDKYIHRMIRLLENNKRN